MINLGSVFLNPFIQVFLGGMIGTSLRYIISLVVSSISMLFIVNIIGSFILGFFTRFYEKKSGNFKPLLTTGILGSYTTFSSFSEQWFHMLDTNILSGISFGIGMFLACFIASLFGYKIMR